MVSPLQCSTINCEKRFGDIPETPDARRYGEGTMSKPTEEQFRKLAESQRFMRQMVAEIVKQYGEDGVLTLRKSGLVIGDVSKEPEIFTSTTDGGVNLVISVKP